ncbi:MAG: VanZ family protein [Opitutales bacterium]|nr:VanZ family protein [Opitutales bacterium]
MNTLVKPLLFPALLTIAIFLASGTSNLATPDVDFPLSKDKIAHFLVFGLLATSILRTPQLINRGWKGALIAILLTSAYGASDELHQALTPERSVELADWIADTAGAIVAVWVYQNWALYRNLLEWKPIQRCKRPVEQAG